MGGFIGGGSGQDLHRYWRSSCICLMASSLRCSWWLACVLGRRSLCALAAEYLVCDGLRGLLSVVSWWRLVDWCLRVLFGDVCFSLCGLRSGVRWLLSVVLCCRLGDLCLRLWFGDVCLSRSGLRSDVPYFLSVLLLRCVVVADCVFRGLRSCVWWRFDVL